MKIVIDVDKDDKDKVQAVVDFLYDDKESKGKWFCSKCNIEIPLHVKEWSETNLGKALCWVCQAKAKDK